MADLDPAKRALADIGELSRYASSLARIGAGLLDEAEHTDFARNDGWPHEPTLDDISRLFEVIGLLAEDARALADAAGFRSSDDFAAHREHRPSAFTAAAARTERP